MQGEGKLPTYLEEKTHVLQRVITTRLILDILQKKTVGLEQMKTQTFVFLQMDNASKGKNLRL